MVGTTVAFISGAALGHAGGVHTPRVFVSYRRADEPFAAGLLSSLLSEGVGQHEVFLDTRYLRQRGNFGPQLLDAVRDSVMVLAVVGPACDSEVNLGRLRRPEDWVRQELLTAKEHRIPIVPVLVDGRSRRRSSRS